MMFEGTQGAGDLGRVDAEGAAPGSPAGTQLLRIGGAVTLTFTPARAGDASAAVGASGTAVLEWCGGSDADMVADAVVAVVLQAAGQPPGLPAIEVQRHKAIAAGDGEAAARAELGIVTSLLGAQFGPARVDADQARLLLPLLLGREMCALACIRALLWLCTRSLTLRLPSRPRSPQGLIFVAVDGQHVVVESKSGKVQCADATLQARVQRALERMRAALAPCDVSDLT